MQKKTTAKPRRSTATTKRKGSSTASTTHPGTTKKHVPWGRTLSTYDNYLGKQKTNSKKERGVVVIDNNLDNDLAVVPLSTRRGTNRTWLPNYQDGKSYYKHYVEIEDDEGNPIKVNSKFRANHKNMDMSKKDVIEIKDKIFNHSKQSSRNKSMLKKFHKKSRD